MSSDQKLENLKNNLKAMGSAAIAFSGGVDSAFLVKVAHDALGNKVLAVTATSETYPESELKDAKDLAKIIGVKHKVIKTQELKKKNFSQNSPLRCYFCKGELFSELQKIAKAKRIKYVLDASNLDDLSDYRPGRKAAKELGVRSPLAEAGLTKKEIRVFSKKMGLPTWSKPSQACLASRIPYGTKITEKELAKVDNAENFLRQLGLRELRVRNHGQIARIEVPPKDLPLVFKNNQTIVQKFKEIGFIYVTLDLQGYRTGSLNEVLKNA
ncbi:MAG: ATP-dependent sacrificial sulfur transferase LarE [Candidatus Nealsonbacteria bacterium]|nr:ATP-dependent sacrificial sulfur transferase LarE [Candidatus Nealsonbacteria bacterium]